MRFVLVGGGRDEAHAEGRLRLAWITSYSPGYVDDVGNYLAAFDVFIYPSRHEGLGSILLDALEFGLPVVGTAVGGIPEIIDHDKNGFLCSPDDIEALAAAVLRFNRDPDLRGRVGQVNREQGREVFTHAHDEPLHESL